MKAAECGELLNLLLEAERAGARLLAAYLRELRSGSELFARLEAVQRDEAGNCAILIHHLREAGVQPSMTTGNFYRKGLAVQGWRARLEFLNRGQAWVARRIAAALPALPASAARTALQEMHRAHLVNIGLCEELNVDQVGNAGASRVINS